MYRCQSCKTIVPAGRKMLRVVVETREMTYPVFREVKGRNRGAPTRERAGSATGFEIVRELAVCESCGRDLVAAQTEAPVVAQAQAQALA